MSDPGCAPRDAIDQIEIRSPCTVSWAQMRPTRGDDRVRFCGQCRQNVYNVEAMSRGEARRLIAAREGSVCVRILRRPDGTVVTADCWARLRAARRRGLLPFLGLLVLAGFTELAAMGLGLARLTAVPGVRPPLRPRVALPVMGDLPPPPSTPTPPRSDQDDHEMGEKTPPQRHHWMGKAALRPSLLPPNR